MNKRILITGCLGLVGSECVSFFEEKGRDVIGIDANMRSHFFGTPIQYSDKQNLANIDIRDKVSIDELFEQNKFDAIIHAAAQPSHDYAADHVIEDFDVNARGTLILLEATRKYCPEAVFVHVSTDKVYGENMQTELLADSTRNIPSPINGKLYKGTTAMITQGFDESLGLDFAGQRSLFGCSKTAADIYVQEYGNYFGMKTACFRCGCITGKQHEGAEQHGFLAYLARCIKEERTYKIFGFDGKQVRDQIHASDLANVFYHYIQSPREQAEVYNMGGGLERSVSVLEAGEMLSKVIGKPFHHEFHEERKGDRQWDVHDVSKFRNDYPEWEYKYSLQDIIKELSV